MQTRTAERVESWDARPYEGGADALAQLAAADFSGVVAAGGAHLFFVNGRAVAVADGTVADVVEGSGEARSAPERSLSLLLAMHESDGETRARYYTNETPLAETDEALRDAGFTGYVELSENVLSGDYYVAYYGGRSFPVAFVGNVPTVLTGEEAFERAADEVGVYDVVSVDFDFPDLPEPEESVDGTDGAAAGAGGDDATRAGADTEVRGDDAATVGGAALADENDRVDDEDAHESDDAGGEGTRERDVPDELAIAAAGPADDEGADADGGAGGTGDESPGEADDESRDGTSDEDADDTDAGDSGGESDAAALESLGAGSDSPVDADRDDGASDRRGDVTSERDAPTADAEETDAVQSDGERTETAESDDGVDVGATADARTTGRDAPTADDRPTGDDERPGSVGADETSPADSGPDADDAGADGDGVRTGTKADDDADADADGPAPENGTERVGVAEREVHVAELREAIEEREARIADYEDRLAERAERVETLTERAETAEAAVEERDAELDRLRAERDDLRETVATLEDRVAELESALDAAGGRVDPATELDPETALAGTNLFVRYESKAEPTLDALGEADPEAIDANLRLEHHTSFDAVDATVSGDDYRTFLEASAPYRFVSWVVRDLPFEIDETGHRTGLAELYEAIPEIDRAELDGTVAVGTESGETVTESFDVVLRDGMGDPLAVAALNTGRGPVDGDEMEALTAAASRISEGVETLTAAFYVTASFFEPDALEAANDATSDGSFLRRSEKESYVRVARKRGYHLCLVEDRAGSFHVTVPGL
ncbi:DUF7527 domain-containing protein [Halarchaeum nitratireducens]|uniref:DUF7527 domain-containing protein n=1 Tax=Halarchaeum nitratireducens TaxID=489913 RepID=A0A830GCY2_9EURY|nr:hypothetical protein [Halarchaeum nitratireducens]GGN19861.1 hypothetical protein GCM10009021_21200 [Halarchaeum nitratireducens]